MDIKNMQPATAAMRDAIKGVHASVAAQTNRAQRPNKYLVLRNYLSRALGWLHTLGKIDNRFEFQAIGAAARGLLESAVDCLLIHRDKTLDSILKIDFWERSALLKNADLILEYYTRVPPLPAPFAPLAAHAASEDAKEIRRERTNRWGKPNAHPNRWTSQDLPSLARDLDKTPACSLCQHLQLEELYVEHGAGLNLIVHGSGFAGLNLTADDLDHQCITMLYHAWHLAATVGLVAAHEVFDGRIHLSEIQDALLKASAIFRKVAGMSA